MGDGGGGPWRVTEEVARGGSRRRWPVQVTEEAVRGGSRRRRSVGGHGGGGPWGVAEEVARGGVAEEAGPVAWVTEEVVRGAGRGGGGPCRSRRRWSVGGHRGGGPVHVTEVVRAGRGGGGPCRSWSRWSVHTTEETSFRNSESYRCFWFSLL